MFESRGRKGCARILALMGAGDGGLGFTADLAREHIEAGERSRRVRKTAKALDKLPKTLRPVARGKIHQMDPASAKEPVLKAFDAFLALSVARHPKTGERLRKIHEALFTFHAFPAAHSRRLRTINPIESTFAVARPRTERTKGRESRKSALTLVWQPTRSAQKSPRRLHASELPAQGVEGVVFIGDEEKQVAA